MKASPARKTKAKKASAKKPPVRNPAAKKPAGRADIRAPVDSEAQPSTVELVFREVTTETWADFEELFESRGGPKSCWCMVWRATAEEARRTDGPSRKAAMRKRVRAGVPVGLLGYQSDHAVAWCSIAPRATYRAGLAPIQEGDEHESIWSLVCFFVTRTVRARGLLKQLIAAAKARAEAGGGTVLEAYPVDQDSPSFRFMGFVPTFEEASFVRIGRAGTRRHIMRCRLPDHEHKP